MYLKDTKSGSVSDTAHRKLNCYLQFCWGDDAATGGILYLPSEILNSVIISKEFHYIHYIHISEIYKFFVQT